MRWALQMSLLVWTGRFGIPFSPIPNRDPMVMALGEPIDVEAVAEPTREQVAELHARYCQALQDLFDEHKHKLGWEHKTLHFEDEDLAAISAAERCGDNKKTD